MANRKLPFWRRRVYQAVAAAVAGASVAVLGANFFLAQQFQPAGAVAAYLTAIQTRNAHSAWNVAEVQAPQGPTAASLVDLDGLRRALAQGAPDIQAFDVSGSHYLDAEQTAATVDVSYQTSYGSRQTTFQVVRGAERHFGIYPSWRVLIQPAILNLTLPPAAKLVTIDGQEVQVSGQTVSAAVWPLRHRITFPGTAELVEQSVTVDLFDVKSSSVVAAPKLTPAGQSGAVSAIKAAFARCAAQTNLQPDGCPQRYDDPYTNAGAWRIIGDPTQDLAIAFDKQANLTASGRYQMVLAYPDADRTLHTAVAGGFVALLAVDPSDIGVATLAASNNLPALQRPSAATDEAIKAVVAKGMTACAATRSADPPDCPQQFIFPATVTGWKMSSDPLAGATVTFDPGSGLFTVQGTFQMTASYEDLGSPETRPSATTSYEATVLWDGLAPELITISGGYA